MIYRAEIQQKCYEATRWTPQYDSYGRTYYLHSDTGKPTHINTIYTCGIYLPTSPSLTSLHLLCSLLPP